MMRTLLILYVCLFASVAMAQDELTIVSPHWEGIRYEIGNAFAAHHQHLTGRTLNIKWMDVGGTSDILRFIFSEFKNRPDSIGVDLLFGGGTDPFVQLKSAGLLVSHRPPEESMAKIGKDVVGISLHDADGYFYAPVMAAFGIMCNREVLRRLNLREPETWDDLIQPGLYSWVGSADPRKSGSIHMVYEVLLQAYGWDAGWKLIFRLAHNMRPIVANSAQVAKDVASGELACGFSIDSHAWAQVKELGPENIAFIVPKTGRVANGDGEAIIKGAPNQRIAEEFIDFTLSDQAQKLWFYRQGVPGGPVRYELSRLPVMPEIYSNSELSAISIRPFNWEPTFKYDNDLGAKRWAIFNDLFSTFVMDQQRSLGVKARSEPPISQGELDQLISSGGWNNQATRTKTISTWEKMAASSAYGGSSLLPRVLSWIVLIAFLGVLWLRKK